MHGGWKILLFAWPIFFLPLGGMAGEAGKLAPGSLTWMINIHALQLIEREGPEAKALAEAYFNQAKTFVMATPAQLGKLPPRCHPTATFPSYMGFKKTVESGGLDPRYQAVIYDSEDWSFTPVEEKADPAKYYALFAALAHARHLLFLATPATNLAKVLDPGLAGGKYDDYVRLRVAAAAARGADIYEAQAQGAEMSKERYRDFVVAAAAQARAANPEVLVLAGLSTNPTGQRPDAEQVFEAVLATAATVDGYWLNIPGRSPYCPRCGRPQAALAVELLKKMSAYAGSPVRP